MKSEFWRRLKVLRNRMRRRVADVHDAYVAEVLASVPVDDDTRALAEGVNAVAEAEGFDVGDPEGVRGLYRFILSHCPALMELAHAATERQAGLVPVPVIVNGLRELPSAGETNGDSEAAP
jgi:hypothetical protein